MKTALVTGAAKRIGRAIAERLLLGNYRLVLHANTSFSELEQWVSKHPKKDQVHALVRGELSHEDGQNAFIADVNARIEELDLLVHNASLFLPANFASISRQQFHEMMGINFEAPFFITQGLLSKLMAAQEPCVINIVDAMWQRPSPLYAHYASSKAALVGFTRALANELAPQVRVNGVAPGAILFPPSYSDEMCEKFLARIPFKRVGNAKDIANAVYFLSEEAHYASGEILVLDGGRSIAP